MNALRKSINQRLQELGVEERAWPGRDNGFASLVFRGKEFAHFHNDSEIGVVEHVFPADAAHAAEEFAAELYSAQFDARRLMLE